MNWTDGDWIRVPIGWEAPDKLILATIQFSQPLRRQMLTALARQLQVLIDTGAEEISDSEPSAPSVNEDDGMRPPGEDTGAGR